MFKWFKHKPRLAPGFTKDDVNDLAERSDIKNKNYGPNLQSAIKTIDATIIETVTAKCRQCVVGPAMSWDKADALRAHYEMRGFDVPKPERSKDVVGAWFVTISW